jgi:hypothetical protein
MRSSSQSIHRFLDLLIALFALAATSVAQAEDTPPEDSSSTLYYVLVVFGFAVLALTVYIWHRGKNAVETPKYNYNPSGITYNDNGSYDLGVDADKDLEWLRKARKTSPKPDRKSPDTRKPLAAAARSSDEPADLDTKVFQEKMRKMQYTQLPINSFSQLAPAKRYTPLELSDDPSLLTAIEQANEEYEDDESVRDLAVRILTAFRNRNSVDALSQIALYDLSSNLRSKAVTTLADFDHESVFETILLACADPTREVRAAAARGLFRLSFDRAHAWKRIIEANDDYRMSHAARAAVESGIVGKSFDRLVHEDTKIAYEAFALVSLLIKAGETDVIFDALRQHKDERVKYALLHVLRVQKDERTLEMLHKLRVDSSWPTDVSDRIREAINSFEAVPA